MSALTDAVTRARTAQATWAALPVRERVKPLKTLRKRLLQNGEALATAMWTELGKPWGDTFTGEIITVADLCAQWTANGPRLLAPRKIPLDPLSYARKTCLSVLVPKGVIGLITPWNMPVAIPMRTIVPALLAGNAVQWKPSEIAPESSKVLYGLLADLFPKDLLQLHLGDGALGAELIQSGVDHVVFTGSVATGRKIEKICAERSVTCGLELGGKDAAIVLADAPFDRTVQGVMWGAFNMTGQNCASIERLIVEKAIADKLIAALRSETQKLHCGPDYKIDDTDVGPLASERQLQTVIAHVDDAVKRGAKVLCGGKALGGKFYAPTILTDVPQDALIWSDETFGPVLPIAVVDTAEQAIAAANASRFGLTASVWTKDIARGEAMLAKLHTGVAMVNNACFTGAVAMAPWTGVGDSGHGATNSEFALYELTRPRTLLIDRSTAARELWWYPFTPAFRQLTLALSRFLSGQLGALPSVLKWFPKRFRRA
jgi:acyl-CoA reductase-like NAD-dependent aldehyde dehydrogenase